MQNNWIVYKHTNIINNKSYIGITSRNPEDRWGKQGEKYRPAKGRYSSFYSAIKKYGWNNFTHEILLEYLSFEEASCKEKELIIFYNTKAPNGYNLTDGGEGTCGYEPGKDFCKRRSELTSGGSNPTAKKVIYGDKIFDTVNECADYLNVNRNKIVRWITGQTFIPKIYMDNGLRFSDEEPNYKIGKRKAPNCKEIYYDGEIFQSVTECANYLKISTTTLKDWLKGNKPVRKDKWYIIEGKELRYADELESKVTKMDYSKQISHMGDKRFYNKED